MALSHYWVNDNLTLHPTLLEDRSPLFRDQEIGGDDVDDIDAGEQPDCRGERIARGHRANHEGTKPTDTATKIEKHILSCGARFGRIEFRQERAVTAEHAIDKYSHHDTDDEQCEWPRQRRENDHHDRSTRLEGEQRRPPPDRVGKIAEGKDAKGHAENCGRNPQSRMQGIVAEATPQIARQPDHQAVITEVLHTA